MGVVIIITIGVIIRIDLEMSSLSIFLEGLSHQSDEVY